MIKRTLIAIGLYFLMFWSFAGTLFAQEAKPIIYPCGSDKHDCLKPVHPCDCFQKAPSIPSRVSWSTLLSARESMRPYLEPLDGNLFLVCWDPDWLRDSKKVRTLSLNAIPKSRPPFTLCQF